MLWFCVDADAPEQLLRRPVHLQAESIQHLHVDLTFSTFYGGYGSGWKACQLFKGSLRNPFCPPHALEVGTKSDFAVLIHNSFPLYMRIAIYSLQLYQETAL